MIKLIAIVDKNFGVSKCGDIPWQFKEDLNFFKRKTENSVVIMGKHTFFSIPNRPLKNRVNCVISNSTQNIEGAELFLSLEKAIEKYMQHDIWIIGGAKTYNYALTQGLVDYALITKVFENHKADKFINESLLNHFQKNEILRTNEYSVYEYL